MKFCNEVFHIASYNQFHAQRVFISLTKIREITRLDKAMETNTLLVSTF
jgi:hypothetical protein